ncbi:MAG: ribosome recycling factor [bacterium]
MATTIEEVFAELTEKAQEALDSYKREIAKVRTGRASPSLVEGLRIEYYGTLTPLIQVAAIKVPEARVLVIEPWDKSVLADIEKAITNSDLGLNPSNDGLIIRITLPPLTEERRKEMSKLVGKKAEDAKAHLRTLRNKVKDHLKALELSEDEERREEKNVQDEFDAFHKTVDDLRDKKIAEVMEV